ncbi:MAG: hypothetical protein GX778_07275 [Erysipelothrix sp.]|nr:hypothetical protein [Erysipelothrix sp.]
MQNNKSKSLKFGENIKFVMILSAVFIVVLVGGLLTLVFTFDYTGTNIGELFAQLMVTGSIETIIIVLVLNYIIKRRQERAAFKQCYRLTYRELNDIVRSLKQICVMTVNDGQFLDGTYEKMYKNTLQNLNARVTPKLTSKRGQINFHVGPGLFDFEKIEVGFSGQRSYLFKQIYDNICKFFDKYKTLLTPSLFNTLSSLISLLERKTLQTNSLNPSLRLSIAKGIEGDPENAAKLHREFLKEIDVHIKSIENFLDSNKL